MASQTRIRNYKTEKENGQLDLWRGLEIVREERLKDTFDILQLAQIFVFCSLPKTQPVVVTVLRQLPRFVQFVRDAGASVTN